LVTFLTATKLEKLQREIYEQFLDNVMKPYVKKRKLMLIVGSWKGQTNPALYGEKFLEENEEPTCSLKIVPP
jgi:hypothetical protein